MRLQPETLSRLAIKGAVPTKTDARLKKQPMSNLDILT